MVNVKINDTVKIPRIPSFLKTEADRTVRISELSDDELRSIGKCWTEQLIASAREMRNRPEDYK